MKHVAIFVPQFPVLTETFVATEIDALINAGHKVSVITFCYRCVVTKHPYPVYELRRYKCAASINGLLKTTVSNRVRAGKLHRVKLPSVTCYFCISLQINYL